MASNKKGAGEVAVTEDSMMEEMKLYIKKNGPNHVDQFISRQLESWKKVDINVAVTGSAGSGKSSFINCMRDLTADDEGAAPVGVVECTTEASCYDHPKNKQFKFWDLPGVGTVTFPQSSYVQKFQFHKYDFFVIISCTRFTREDAWLASEVRKLGKSFFFVRTKLDEDIENDARVNRSHLPEAVVRQIRMNCREKLAAEGFPNPDIFVISNFYATKWDFPDLNEAFVTCLPSVKQEAWRLSMRSLNVAAIKAKRAHLQSKVWMAATASAGAAAIPIPGVDVAVDLILLTKYQNDYIAHFGLDDASMKERALTIGRDLNELKKLTPQVTKLITSGVKVLVQRFATSVAAESVAKYIPIVGSVVAATISFAVTYAVLIQILDSVEQEAIAVLEYTIRHSDM